MFCDRHYPKIRHTTPTPHRLLAGILLCFHIAFAYARRIPDDSIRFQDFSAQFLRRD